MIIYIGDTTIGVLDKNSKTYKYPCYWCGENKDSSIRYYDYCCPTCEKAWQKERLLMDIERGDIVIGFDPIFLNPEELAFIGLP